VELVEEEEEEEEDDDDDDDNDDDFRLKTKVLTASISMYVC
jgi:hypothetical protein